MDARWLEISNASRSTRADYRLDPKPIATGGQARVFSATHKQTGHRVAFKRLMSPNEDATARMRREIEVGMAIQHRHVMPVLDADLDSTWFVMPLAATNLLNARNRQPADERIHLVIQSVANGLEQGHQRGWIHRDVNPRNILRIDSEGKNRWVIADWGLARRPRGETSTPGRTRAGVSIGTEGFAAPELSVDAHEATQACDIYGLGQVIGWLVTGTWPRANTPLIPSSGPWRVVVRRAAHPVPDQRIQTCGELLDMIESELAEPAPSTKEFAESLVEAFKKGDQSAAGELFAAAHRNEDSYEVFIDILPSLPAEGTMHAAAQDPDRAKDLVQAMHRHFDHGDWSYRPYRWADQVIWWFLRVCKAAVQVDDLELLEVAAEALIDCDSRWNQWPPQDEIRDWLSSLRDDNARALASILRRHQDSAQHFADLKEVSTVDARIRAALPG